MYAIFMLFPILWFTSYPTPECCNPSERQNISIKNPFLMTSFTTIIFVIYWLYSPLCQGIHLQYKYCITLQSYKEKLNDARFSC